MNNWYAQGILTRDPKIGIHNKEPWASCQIMVESDEGDKTYKAYVDFWAHGSAVAVLETCRKDDMILIEQARIYKSQDKKTKEWVLNVDVTKCQFLEVEQPQAPQTIKQNVERVKAALAGVAPAVKAQNQRQFLQEEDIPF